MVVSMFDAARQLLETGRLAKLSYIVSAGRIGALNLLPGDPCPTSLLKNSWWYHATVNGSWLADVQAADAHVHLGTMDAAYSRRWTETFKQARAEAASSGNSTWQEGCYDFDLYLNALRVKPGTNFCPFIARDDVRGRVFIPGEVELLEKQYDAIAYVNDYEHVGSLSLSIKASALERHATEFWTTDTSVLPQWIGRTPKQTQREWAERQSIPFPESMHETLANRWGDLRWH